jgi:hypothetical protein
MCWTISLKPATRPIGGDRRRLCCQQRLLPERLQYGIPRIEAWYDRLTEGIDTEEHCPRCGTHFSETPLVAIEVAERGVQKPSGTTFYVEDDAQKTVVQAVAKELGKQISVDIRGNAPQVEALFAFSESQGGWANCYFIVDGDNKPCRHRDKNNFIQLDRYCIENYLLDLEIWAVLSNGVADQLREDLVSTVHDHRHEITKGSPLLEFFFDRLGVREIEALLVYIDVSRLVLPRLLREINMSEKAFMERYIALAHSTSRMREVLPKRIVEIIEELSNNG